jgi:hypothetical protein
MANSLPVLDEAEYLQSTPAGNAKNAKPSTLTNTKK